MTIRMIIELVEYVFVMISTFPPKSGLSRKYIPRIILTGKQLDFKKQCRCPFGAYINSHDDRSVTNLLVHRTQGAIYIGPTGNLQGSYALLSLRTGMNITQSQFTELPTPPPVTRRLIAMAMHEKQKKGLVFEDRNRVDLPMTDEDRPSDGAGATGVDIGNIYNHLYLGNKSYKEIDNDDDDDDNTAGDTNIEIVAAPAVIFIFKNA